MISASVRETRALLMRGEVTVVDHVQSVLTAIRATNPDLRAFLSIADESSLRAAQAADALIRARGASAWRSQPLLGMTVAVKDLIQTRDLPTTRGSRLENRRARVDPPAVARLQAAGAIVIGKTATSEFGWSASTVAPVAAPTRNPWDPERSAGGSSGGSAAAVSAGLCTAALGTDGAGSIRIPAAFCGVVGFKPSFGRVPYVPACADRLAHLGPLARTVPDIIELIAVLTGPHREDPDSEIGPLEALPAPPHLRIGWIEFPGTTAEVRRVSERLWSALTGAGHRVEPIDVPFPNPYPALVDILAATEAANTPPAAEPHSDPGRVAIVRYGRTVTGAALAHAEAVRLTLRTTLRSVMERYHLLAMATVPIEPFDVHAIGPSWAAEPANLRWLAWAPATYPFNLTGQPALSLPVGYTSAGLPVGIQLVGPIGADELVLATACRVEAELGSAPATSDRVMEGTV